MAKNFCVTFKIIGTLCFLLIIFPESYQAYTDLSTYRIETGKFVDENKAKTAVTQLKKDTGWTGTYKVTSDYQEYYQISSGLYTGVSKVKSVLQQFENKTGIEGVYVGVGKPQDYFQIVSGLYTGESKVKSVLQQFEERTGIEGVYVGAGEPQDYYQIVSGLYTGESKAKSVLGKFENATGIQGNYIGVGEQQKYYQITTGGFSGESRVKQVLREFENSTGINGTHIGIGQSEKYYQISSGGFIGQSRVKQVLQQFVKATGIKATYISLGNDRYKITSEPVLGLTETSKGLNFFKSNNWWVTYKSNGKVGYKTYRIQSDPVLGHSEVQKGVGFFKNNNWWVTYQSTGENGYEKYQVKSDPVLGANLANKGSEFFKSNNWTVTYQPTGKKGYEKYQIKSNSVLGIDMVNKGVGFFKSNNWSVTYQSTGRKGYEKYQIKSDPVLGLNLVNKGTGFFTSNNWSVTYQPTGKKQYNYKIVIEGFKGYDKANSAIQKLKQLYDWDSISVKTKNGPKLMYTDYGITLSSMVDKQMAMSPQTDKYGNEPRYVHADYVDMNKEVITGDGVYLRTAPSTTSTVIQKLNKGDRVLVIGKTGDWVEVRLTWQNAQASDVSYYLNPDNFSIDNKNYFQFIKLSEPAYLNVTEVNGKILNGKGILAGKGEAFVDAARKYNINEVYLISHALLETGNGTSTLAKGVVYNGKTVYNMYGYGAADSCPITCGAKAAYDNGWFTPEAAIIGGAKFISIGYIYNSTFQQDTLYKMRWNPVVTWHQYASDIGWAYKQVYSIYNLYQLIDNYTLYFDVPSYR